MNDIDDIKRRAGINEQDFGKQQAIRDFVSSGTRLIPLLTKEDGSFSLDDLEKINATVETIGAWAKRLFKMTPEYQHRDD